MAKTNGFYVKTNDDLKEHVNSYVQRKKEKGGVSGLVRRLLAKETGYKKEV